MPLIVTKVPFISLLGPGVALIKKWFIVIIEGVNISYRSFTLH